MKFNKGDLVKIVGNHNFHGFGIGETVSIVEFYGTFCGCEAYCAKGDVNSYIIRECDFIPVNKSQSIVIYQKGIEVIANIKDGKKVIKSAKATCNPSDEFVFEVGAKLAFKRLMGEEDNPEPKTFKKAKLGDKIKVIDASGNFQNPRLVLGKEYVVDYIDGVCVGSNGNYFNDGKKRYIITEENIIEDFTTDELLTEIKRRMK